VDIVPGKSKIVGFNSLPIQSSRAKKKGNSRQYDKRTALTHLHRWGKDAKKWKPNMSTKKYAGKKKLRGKKKKRSDLDELQNRLRNRSKIQEKEDWDGQSREDRPVSALNRRGEKTTMAGGSNWKDESSQKSENSELLCVSQNRGKAKGKASTQWEII